MGEQAPGAERGGGLLPADPVVLRAVLEAIPELVFVLARDGTYLDVFGGRDATRYHDARTLIGKRIGDVVSPDIAAEFLARIAEALDSGEVVAYDYQLSRREIEGVEARDGLADVLWFEGHVSPLPPEAGGEDRVVWMAFNVTERQELLLELDARQAELEQLASTDSLTGLRNRRSFLVGVEVELGWTQRTGAPSALILLDVDHFKQVNDTFGHAAGDRVLQAVALLLAGDRRRSDVVGRLGGEEFALVVRGADLDHGLRFAERLRAELADLTVAVPGGTVQVTASFGVATLHPDDPDVDAVLRRADAAMYVAKDRGRNRVVVEGERGDGAVGTAAG